MTKAEVFAPAKINLALHITGQRADGYHLIDSIVAFADIGDRVSLRPTSMPEFDVTGPFAAGVPLSDDNLVLKALQLVAPESAFSVTLEKNLPTASGIGGGSSDAAAAARGAEALTESDTGGFLSELVSLGADVPMCIAPRPCRVSGIGEQINDIPPFPPLPAVLVNPLQPLSTQDVFKGLSNKSNAALPQQVPHFASVTEAATWLANQRNDLEPPAIARLPVIADVSRAVANSDACLLARMSGSGATVFGLYPDVRHALAAARALQAKHSDWWVKATTIGDASEAARPVLS